ncbi:TPA: hypothetical protein ACNVQT_004018 [Citrobacter farmeri]
MTCRNALKRTLFTGLVALLLSPLLAQASIEKTVMASYDLATGKSAHYQLHIISREKQTTFSVTPLNAQDNTPSTFKMYLCFDRLYGTAKHGQYRASAVNINKSDLRLSNIGYFVSEQNLATWWLYLNDHEDLMLNAEVGGLLVIDPNLLNNKVDKCDKN